MNKQNPYRAPQASTTQTPARERRRKLHLASKGQRVLNLFIDAVVSMALVLGAFVLMAFVLPGMSEDRPPTPSESAISLFAVSAPFLYYFGMEAAFGRTLGKFLTGTRVVDALGHKPTLLAIAGRTLCRLIPLEWVTFLLKDSGLHDTLSGTRVVLASRLEEQE